MDITSFLTTHRLPSSYSEVAQKWFMPLGDEIAEHQKGAGRPFFVGVNGCQGSGKSTLSDFLVYYLTQQYELNVVSLSLDDFYLDKSSRNALAVKVHPLLATRGVPGTHNVELAQFTFDRLKDYGTVSIPRFNKSIDDPYPVIDWPVVHCPPDIVIVEGWCWGAPAQDSSALIQPVNDLEDTHDPLGVWRRYVNTQLEEAYQPLFDQMQYWVMLKAPSFEQVYHWRLEQEQKLIAKVGKNASGTMNELQVKRFIAHYQRLTEHCLNVLADKCDHVFELDDQRNIVNVIKAAK